MNKLRPLTFLLLSAFLIQSCKKDTVTAVAYTTAAFQANIDGATWPPASPDSVSSSITYNAAAKTKVFSLTGTKDQKQVILSVTLSNAGSGSGFPALLYDIDSTSVVAHYNTLQKNSSGNYVFLPHGSVGHGAGYITITAVDSVKKQITGT